MLDEIYKAAEQEAPNEMCGLLVEENGIEKCLNITAGWRDATRVII